MVFGLGFRLGNPDLRALFFLSFDFDLIESDFDAFGVIVWDEFGVSNLINERLASSSEVINVERFG
jgi:hypothetical protein